MRALILTAFVTLLLFSCKNSNLQQIEAAGNKVKQCINNCSLNMPSVSTCPKDKAGVNEAAVSTQASAGAERMPTVLTNHFNMW